MYFLIVPWTWSKSDWGWRRRHKSACAKWERSRFKLQHCQSRSTAKCLWLTWGTNQTGRNYLSFILTGKIRLSLPGGGPSDHDERKSNYRGSGFSAHISRNDVGTYVWLSAANWSKDTVCYAWCSKDLKSYTVTYQLKTTEVLCVCVLLWLPRGLHTAAFEALGNARTLRNDNSSRWGQSHTGRTFLEVAACNFHKEKLTQMLMLLLD